MTTSPLGQMIQADGSPSMARSCALEYGDTIDGMVQMQSATATWGVGYLKWKTKKGATCEVGAPAHDPKYIVGIPHGAYVRNRNAYIRKHPALVYGQCSPGYDVVQTREQCTIAFKSLFGAMQVTGQDETQSIMDGSQPGLRGCFVDTSGNGRWQPSESLCIDRNTGSSSGKCDELQPVCYLTDADMSSGHGRRSMSYINADGRLLTRVGWYNVLNAVVLPPTISEFMYEPQVVRFGGFAPVFMKKIFENKFDLPSQVEWKGAPPVPRPQSVASHTYCNEDDVPRTFGAYSRSVTMEVGNEFCYSSYTSRTFSLSVSVDFKMCATGCFEAGGGMDYENSAARSTTSCKSTTKSTTESMSFPTITLPPRSAVQYTFTRRETVFQDAAITATERVVFVDGTSESMGSQEIKIQGVARTGTLATFSEVVQLGNGISSQCGYGQASLGAIKQPAVAPPPAPSGRVTLPTVPTAAVPAEYNTASFGCGHSALKMHKLASSMHDWGVEQLALDTRGQARGFSVADGLFGSGGCPALIGAVSFNAAQDSRSVVTSLTFTSGLVSLGVGKGEQEMITGVVVAFQRGAIQYFGQTAHDGDKGVKTTVCQLPMNSLLTGLMHIGSQGRGANARLGYVRFHVKLPGNAGVSRCEPVKRSRSTKVRSFYVERRIISGVIASGLNPLENVGGLTEFAFTFWKRVTQVKILGAGGADKLDANKLGEPDVPSPENEYFHNYCNSDKGAMTFGEAQYDSSLSDSSSVCTEDSKESTVGGFGYAGGGFEAEVNVCAGLGVSSCSTALSMEFMVRVTAGGSSTSGSSSSKCESKATTKSTTLVMPGITLAGQESTEYKVTIFRKKMSDITVQLIKQLRFEDGTTALMPPQDFKIKGVMTTSSMASFQRQVKNITKGCSYIVAPAKEPI
jgi:hypothetical protein